MTDAFRAFVARMAQLWAGEPGCYMIMLVIDKDKRWSVQRVGKMEGA